MKKFCKAFAVMLLLVAAFTVLTACNGVAKIDDFKEKLVNADSLELSFSVEALGMEYSYTMKIDGDKAYYVDSELSQNYIPLKKQFYTAKSRV